MTQFVTALEAIAQQAHEAFEAFTHAGFSEEQAMTLIVGMLTGGDRNG